MKITEQWVRKNCCFKQNTKFADVLPKSDNNKFTEDDIVRKQGWEGNNVRKISRMIPEDIAKQIENDYGELSFLDNGCFGVVYRNENKPGWLIKITIKLEEIEIARVLSGKNISCLVPYDTSKIYTSKESDIKIGLIETKEVEKLPKPEAICFNIIRDFFEFESTFGTGFDALKMYIEYLVKKHVIRENEFSMELWNEVYSKFDNMMKCLESNNLEYADIKWNNIGKETDGRYVIFDFGLLFEKAKD